MLQKLASSPNMYLETHVFFANRHAELILIMRVATLVRQTLSRMQEVGLEARSSGVDCALCVFALREHDDPRRDIPWS